MKKSTLYRNFLSRWQEVMDLPPQRLGPLTPYYHAIVRRLKVMPWPWLVMASAGVVLAIYFLLGSAITFLVTLLQRGF